MTNRLPLFLYSSGNIAGSLLALGGLGLFFAGVIHAYWWFIVPGLYGIGVLGWPTNRNRLVQQVEHTELSLDLLSTQVHKLIHAVVPGLPHASVDSLRSIELTLNDLLPRLRDLRQRGVISVRDSFTVTETVRRYLPDTLGAYLRLPSLYAQMQPLADGRTASQTLLDQLQVLDHSLKEIAQSAFDGDAEKLITNGQFLQNRFSEKLAFKR